MIDSEMVENSGDTSKQDELKNSTEPASEVSQDSDAVAAAAQDQLSKELSDMKAKYLRLVADMDNLRKRAAKEKQDTLLHGQEKMMLDILPVLDSFEKALLPENEGNKESFIEGMHMVYKQLSDTLVKHGLEPMTAQGQVFDPNFHQAIQKVESVEVKKETVQEEFVKGYCLKNKLLRAAMVSVAVPTPAPVDT